MNLADYGPKPGGPTHPAPTHPDPRPLPPPVPQPTKFRVPAEPTALNALIDCGRAWGKALIGIARLFAGRPVL